MTSSIGDLFIIIGKLVGRTDEGVTVTVKYLCKFRKSNPGQGSVELFSEVSKPTVHRQNRSQYL